MLGLSVAARRRLLSTVTCALMLTLVASAVAKVEVVTKRKVSYKHFTTVQAAVNAAKPGDFIMIDRGTYNGSVLVSKANLHIRGLDRNAVVLDGQHRKNTNGIEVLTADNVWVENLTVPDDLP